MAVLQMSPQSGRDDIPAAGCFFLWDASLWRQRMAEQIACAMDAAAFGVKGVYLFGSAESGDAGQGSDIDLIFHTDGDAGKKRLLELWLAGWNESLCVFNEMLTGYRQDYILDPHYITDDDIANRECFAAKIHSVHEPATRLA